MGLQCQKLIWFRYNAKDQIPAPDEATQAVFDQGTEVGELARQLFPGGIVVAPGIINPTKSSPKPKRQFKAANLCMKPRLFFTAATPARTSRAGGP